MARFNIFDLFDRRRQALPRSVADTVQETRFAERLTTQFSRRSPYVPAVTGRDFPTVPTGWHPGVPPLKRVIPDGPASMASARVPSGDTTAAPRYLDNAGIGADVLVGGARNVARRARR
jgi:hypothetical protein